MKFGEIVQNVTNQANTATDRNGNVTTQKIDSSFQSDGFIVSERPSADGTGLPSSKVISNIPGAKQKRRLMSWFVPEVGVVKMYINPQSIQFSEGKIISETQTKGGFVMQYWGEKLASLTIQGTTGSSGVEGLNVLREIYRSEQLTFDPIGLSMAANSQISGLDDLLTGNETGGFGDIIGSGLSNLIGAAAPTSNILPYNIPSLASLALGIELYYDGWVFRGYFTDFSYTDSVQNFGAFDYTMNFKVTQRRGYRTNYMPWHRSAIDGPSNNGTGGIPLTFRKEGE